MQSVPERAYKFRVRRKDSGHRGDVHYFDLVLTTLVWNKQLMCPQMSSVLLAEISFSSLTGEPRRDRVLQQFVTEQIKTGSCHAQQMLSLEMGYICL